MRTDRTKNEKNVKKYHRRVKFAGWALSFSPFVRCVILNGSYASGDEGPNSDIDILLVAKSGRVFTLRFFSVLTVSILGIKRPNIRSADHRGEVCLNYYLTENFLKIPVGRGEAMDRYCAENYSKSKFMAGDHSLFEQFMRENQKLFSKYLSSPFQRGPLGSRRGFTDSRFPIKSGMTYRWNFIEKILSGNSGDRIESWLKSLQIRKIESDSITEKYPDLIVYNDRELRFHPPKQH